MPFQKGHNKAGGRKKGGLNKKTIVLQDSGVNSMLDFKNLCYENLCYFLNHENDIVRFQATKEICKYLFTLPRYTDREPENEIFKSPF